MFVNCKQMLIRLHKKYKPPKRSIGVPILGHSGELVVPVKETTKLARWLNNGDETVVPQLKRELKKLINTVPTLVV